MIPSCFQLKLKPSETPFVRPTRPRPLMTTPVTAISSFSTKKNSPTNHLHTRVGRKQQLPAVVGTPLLIPHHPFLAQWQQEESFKPRGHDAIGILPPTHRGFDVAAVSVGGRAKGAWKAANQDAFLLHSLDHPDQSPGPSFLVGVFDGHGKLGQRVAAKARASIAAGAASTPPPPAHAEEEQHETYLTNFFSAAAADLENCVDAADFARSGSTAVVCSVQPGRVTAAWTGDSRAVLGLHAFSGGEDDGSSLRPIRAVIPLTRDHKPDPLLCPIETQRIVASGGRVDRLATDRAGNATGPFRVFLPDVWVPGLAVSRAFGDYIVQGVGVIATPEVFSLPLPMASTFSSSSSSTSAVMDSSSSSVDSHSDSHPQQQPHQQQQQQDKKEESEHRHVLIVASDGLWEWISNEKAVEMAYRFSTAQQAAEGLVVAAQQEWAERYFGRTCDDITVAVAFLPVT